MKSIYAAIDAGLANNGNADFQTIGNVWSSTESSGSISDAWYVNFSNGGTSYNGKSGSGYVRCVRDL